LPAGPNGCGPKYGLYDEAGNLTNASLLDFFLPTSVKTPGRETDFTTTPSPHHPIDAKGVGESPNVGGVSAFSNAVNDAFAQQLQRSWPVMYVMPDSTVSDTTRGSAQCHFSHSLFDFRTQEQARGRARLTS
jgi:hypothetical protein